jgi:3-methylfumaryl-CoA hydratase
MNEEFSGWIGRSVTRKDVVTARLLAAYRATMVPWLFEPSEPGQCPPGLHWGLCPATPGYEDVGPDGAEAKGLFLPPIPLPRRMWAGGSIETLRPIMVRQDVRRTSTISDIKFRQGSAGQLYVVSVMHEIADGDLVMIRERQDLVFREGSPKTVPGSDAAKPAQGGGWIVEPSALMLFRFSAFTFNGHRIHYDASYAAEEGYPGLVVHGPLQAALMLNRISEALGQVPLRFDYRCVAPLFSGKAFEVTHDRSTMTTRIIRHDGVTTAEGQAHVQGT